MVDTQMFRRARTGECGNGAGIRTERSIRPDGSGELQSCARGAFYRGIEASCGCAGRTTARTTESRSKNAALLAQVGNLYYDAKQYPAAIIYYERSLKSQPSDTSVGTDLGTAYWYTGDADGAIARFTKVLAIAPTQARHTFQSWYCKVAG